MRKKIRPHLITQWTQQLAMLLQAHLPLGDALQLLAHSQTHLPLKDLTLKIYQAIMSGISLSQVLGSYPQYFDRTYCQLIIAAEQSGQLAKILQRIAEQQRAQQQLRKQLVKAALYPCLVLTVGGVVFVLLLVLVVPAIAEVFIKFKQPLPIFTKIILSIADALQIYGMYFILCGALLGFIFYLAHHYIPGFQNTFARWKWKCFGFGTLLQISGCILFSRTLATLLMAGIPLSLGVTISLQLINNRFAEQRLSSALVLINQGHSFSYSLSQTQLFPALAIQMWQIGEHSGKLSEFLMDSARYYQECLDEFTQQLTQLLEPVLLVVLGVLIGSVVIAMYLPLFNMGLVLG